MGPNVLIDKSAFEAFSKEEALKFCRYFNQGLAPVLFYEVIADLKLEAGFTDENRNIVSNLAKKFIGSGPLIMEDFKKLSLAELFRIQRIPMTGQILPQGATVSPDGGMFVDLTAYNHDILRWSHGEFNARDNAIAEEWRKLIANISNAKLDDLITRHGIILAKCKSMEEVGKLINSLLFTPTLQEPLLEWFINRLNISRQVRRHIVRQWRKLRVLLHRYAPYSALCIKAMLALFVAARNKLIPQRPTNIIDLHYLFYIPFCFVFISDDRVHTRIAPLLLREDQRIITGTVMKAALAKQVGIEKELIEPRKTRILRALGLHPIPIRNNAVSLLWNTYMAKWSRRSCGLDTEISPEEQEKIFREIEDLFEKVNLKDVS